MSGSLAHRKAGKRIRFIDREGNKLSNTSVRVKLVNHQFLIGCGANDSLPATAKVETANGSIGLA